MTAFLLIGLVVVIGDSNALPYDDGGYPTELARLTGERVEALPLPGAGVIRGGRARARPAVRTAALMGATTVVLALGTNDLLTAATPGQVARVTARRYWQARRFAERVRVAPCLPSIPTCLETRAELARLIPPADLIDVSGLGRELFYDPVHLNAAGRAELARRIAEGLR